MAMVRLSGLSERIFSRRFVKATGMSPLDYVQALRLEEAKQILETEDLLVEAVALEVGYQDNGFFGRLFRRKVGMTPAQYRRRWGNLHKLLRRSEPNPSGPLGLAACAIRFVAGPSLGCVRSQITVPTQWFNCRG
jgi:AraC-like DNA-binding protein